MLTVALAACAGNSVGNSGIPPRDAGVSDRGGSSGGGRGGSLGTGGTAISLDAGLAADTALPKSDAGQGNYIPTDAPTFNWDTFACVGCGADASRGPDAVTPAADAASAGGWGGNAAGSGGTAASAGGAPSSGGASGYAGAGGLGGSSGTGGLASMDAGVVADGGRDASPPSDTRTPDGSVAPDVGVFCVARIEAIVPVRSGASSGLLSISAGPNMQAVLRAEIVSGGPTNPVWMWQGDHGGVPISPSAIGKEDPAQASFAVASGGPYTFSVRDATGSCRATLAARAFAPSDCPDCYQGAVVHAAPPASSSIPAQGGYVPIHVSVYGLLPGTGVRVAPNVDGSLVPSYVRISDLNGSVVADGLSSSSAPFTANLIAVDASGFRRLYDLLVVPVDGNGGGTISATAPQLFKNLDTTAINVSGFKLSGQVAVSGVITDSKGGALADVRVILTNQNPAGASRPDNLTFSSVGRTDAQGNFMLRAQPGSYWVTVSPPTSSGLADAVAPSPISLTTNATLSFHWDVPSTAAVALTVVDAAGAASAGTKVRITSAADAKVGTLTFDSVTQDARGNVQVQATTSATGAVVFSDLPDGTSYNVLLSPAVLAANAASTLLTLAIPSGGLEATVRLAAQARVRGKLLPSPGNEIDWSRTSIVAHDRSSDAPEAAVSVMADADGSFSIGVSPTRPYVLVAIPPASSAYARTFVGPGPLRASEFVIRQQVQGSMDWVARAVAQNSNVGVPGVALQAFCEASWPGCIDPTIALAETTSGEGGSFLLKLPDPAKR